MSTASTEERMKREELQMDDRDEDVIETSGERVSEREEPIITPAATSDREERSAGTPAEALRMQETAPAGERVPNKGFGTPTVSDSSDATERWQRIQASFVDDPRKAVGEAHDLVGQTVQRIVDAFTRERNELESQWSKGEDVSTEDLRVCLQHYREFFSKLTPTIDGMRH
jgi:hypothetical protein